MTSYMLRALELARCGVGKVSPNPMVGAVIVVDGEVIGEGYHQKYGEAHAEVNAINSVEDKELLKRATMYVTLEPCSHWGKTPPCADLIVEMGIPRVVVGSIDYNEKVCGQGIAKMRQAGVDVTVGELEQECMELNKRFFTSHTKGRPYVILKWAQTADGALDARNDARQKPAWLTGEQGRRIVHGLRAREDAIIVGRRTVEMDNPSLTVRYAEGENPIRITIDRNLRLSPDYNIFDNQSDTILFTSIENVIPAVDKFRHNHRVSIEPFTDLRGLLCALLSRKIHSLIVEGGAVLLNSFIDAQLWDEAMVFTSPMTTNELYDEKGMITTAPSSIGRDLLRSSDKVGDAVLNRYLCSY